MGVYAITGASSGIGAKTKELLQQRGHEVINIDLKDGDICVPRIGYNSYNFAKRSPKESPIFNGFFRNNASTNSAQVRN